MKKRIILLVVCSLMMLMTGISRAREPDPVYRVIYTNAVEYTGDYDFAGWFTNVLLDACQYYDVDPLLALALFIEESHLNMNAQSDAGAFGIAQVRPSTAVQYGFVDVKDPYQNVFAGVCYLAEQSRRFSDMGEWTATYAIAAYNAGPGSIYDNGNQLPPYKETYFHVKKVHERYIDLLGQVQYWRGFL